MKQRWLTILAVTIWILVGLYGVFFNISYIDEAKYLIKGWLMVTGKVGYYSTPEFFYQHMPGGLLWYGLGQLIFGPNLLVARLQSFLLGLIIVSLTYQLARKLSNYKAGITALLLLSLMPVVSLYYSSAVPQSLAVLMLMLGFLSLTNKKTLLASIWFSLALVVRENFLFSLLIYLGWLISYLKKDWREWLKNLTVVIITLGVFIMPGMPGILNVFKNFPGVSWLLPVSQIEKTVLGLSWQRNLHKPELYFRAIKEFAAIYFSWLIAAAGTIWLALRQKVKLKNKNIWGLLIMVGGFNLLAHGWSAFNLSPRAMVSYMAYVAPLLSVGVGVMIQKRITAKQIRIYLGLLIIALLTMRLAGIFGVFSKKTDLNKLKQSVETVRKVTKNKKRIVWLSEPMALFLAGKVSYYPLINHTNFYKPSQDTTTVRALGFWNQAMMGQWLDEADLVAIDANRVKLLKQSKVTVELADYMISRLNSEFYKLKLSQDIWPGNLSFYQRRPTTR